MRSGDLTIRAINRGARWQNIGLSRRALFIWAILILFFNQLFPVIKDIPEASLETFLKDLVSVGVFQYMAWCVVLRLIWSSDSELPARSQDLLVIVALCVPLFLPTARSIWIAAAAMAIYLWISKERDRDLRAAGLILGALSTQEFWGHAFFNLFAVPLLHAETAVVGTLLGTIRPGTTWQDNVINGPQQFGITIFTGCSSFHNLSLALLCWLTISKSRNQIWRRRDLVIGIIAGATMVIFNVARLCMMAWDFDSYRYWHDGIGAQIYAIGSSITILSISLYGSRSAGKEA